MQRIILGMLLVFLFCKFVSAGILFGRIIQEDGSPLAKTKIVIEGKEITTNEFGGYIVELSDGEQELDVIIDEVPYISEKIIIFSPKTKLENRS